MNAKNEKDTPKAGIYCVRVRTMDEHYSYGAPFVARDDQQARELVGRSLQQLKDDEKKVIDYERGELLCVASYTLWSENAENPIHKRDLRRGGVVCSCADLMIQEVIANA